MFEAIAASLIAGIVLTILGAIFNKREAAIGAGKGIIASILRITSPIFNDLRSLFNAGRKFLSRRHSQVSLYLYRRGIRTMKLNLSVVPNVAETWSNPYLTSPLAKAGYLAAKLNSFMKPGEGIQHICGSNPIRYFLENNSLDSDVFCALVSAHAVERTQEYSQERFQSFPVPYRVIEEIMKDLIGEDEEDSQEAESESQG